MVSEEFVNKTATYKWWHMLLTLLVALTFGTSTVSPSLAADGGSQGGSGVAVTSAISESQQAQAAYNSANQAYIANRANTSSTQKLIQQSFQEAQKSYKLASQAYTQAVKVISGAFANDIAVATRAAKQSLKAANTAELKNQANSALSAAVSAATARRDAALSQLGTLADAPAKPGQSVSQIGGSPVATPTPTTNSGNGSGSQSNSGSGGKGKGKVKGK